MSCSFTWNFPPPPPSPVVRVTWLKMRRPFWRTTGDATREKDTVGHSNMAGTNSSAQTPPSTNYGCIFGNDQFLPTEEFPMHSKWATEWAERFFVLQMCLLLELALGSGEDFQLNSDSSGRRVNIPHNRSCSARVARRPICTVLEN
jgi:hypothetical protein